jgi:hypothetical protein
MVHRREASRPNALWQADHAQLDLMDPYWAHIDFQSP